MEKSRPRVLLADDFPSLLAAWRRLLTPSCEVVGEARDGRTVVRKVGALHPDVVIIDISLPDMSGLDACRALKEEVASTRVILVTADGNPQLAEAAFRAGASAFVVKQSAAEELPLAIRAVMAGQTYCTPFSGE
jgi:DNA-binding NarL/FixJ family response regulator